MTFVPKRKKKEIWFQAIFQKQVVGCSCLLILSKQRIRLSNAFVLGGFRKNGILRTMVAEREQWAIKNKFKMMSKFLIFGAEQRPHINDKSYLIQTL